MHQSHKDDSHHRESIEALTRRPRFLLAYFFFLPSQFFCERYRFFVCHGSLLLPQVGRIPCDLLLRSQ